MLEDVKLEIVYHRFYTSNLISSTFDMCFNLKKKKSFFFSKIHQNRLYPVEQLNGNSSENRIIRLPELILLAWNKIAIFQNKLEANVDVNILRICSQDADTEKHQQKSTWVTVNTAKRQTYTATMILSWCPNS